MNQKVNFQSPRDKHVTEAIKDQLQKARVQGMLGGAKAICSVVLKRIADVNEESSKEELLAAVEEVRQFCKKSLGEDKASN